MAISDIEPGLRVSTRGIIPIGQRRIILTPELQSHSSGISAESLLWRVGQLIFNTALSIDVVRHQERDNAHLCLAIAKPLAIARFDSYADGTQNFIRSEQVFGLLDLVGEPYPCAEMDGCVIHDVTPHIRSLLPPVPK